MGKSLYMLYLTVLFLCFILIPQFWKSAHNLRLFCFPDFVTVLQLFCLDSMTYNLGNIQLRYIVGSLISGLPFVKATNCIEK